MNLMEKMAHLNKHFTKLFQYSKRMGESLSKIFQKITHFYICQFNLLREHFNCIILGFILVYIRIQIIFENDFIRSGSVKQIKPIEFELIVFICDCLSV